MRRAGLGIMIAAASMMVGPALAQEALVVPDSVTPQRVLDGSNLYNGGSCAVCHAIAGRGVGTRAPDLSDIEWLHSEGDFDGIFQTIFWGVSEDEMKAVVPRPFEMHPRGGMNVDREQMKALAAYVWTLSHPETHPFVAEQTRFLELAREGRVDEAVAAFRTARERGREHLLLPESGLNRLGYEILEEDPRAAIALFELNVETNPEAWNVYDSLGEAHMVDGDREAAIRNYRRSLELNPENENAIEKLEKLGVSP